MFAVSNPVNRRVFLENGAPWLVTLGLSPSFLRRTALAMELPRAARGKTPIVLFQRGAADALNVLVSFGEKALLRRATAACDRHSGPRGRRDDCGWGH